MGVGLGSNNILNKGDDDRFGTYKDKSNYSKGNNKERPQVKKIEYKPNEQQTPFWSPD